jgi:hypothetical protein
MPQQPVPPELMQMMQGGAPGGAAGAPPGAQAPASAPMSTPQPNEGEKGGATAQVQMAVEVLEQTLSAFGSDSEEGQTVLKVLTILGKQFGEKRDKARGLIPSEIMNLVSSMPKGAGGPPPGAPPGAGAPPGMPPGAPPQPPMM